MITTRDILWSQRRMNVRFRRLFKRRMATVVRTSKKVMIANTVRSRQEIRLLIKAFQRFSKMGLKHPRWVSISPSLINLYSEECVLCLGKRYPKNYNRPPKRFKTPEEESLRRSPPLYQNHPKDGPIPV